jgi:hypothetical protein
MYKFTYNCKFSTFHYSLLQNSYYSSHSTYSHYTHLFLHITNTSLVTMRSSLLSYHDFAILMERSCGCHLFLPDFTYCTCTIHSCFISINLLPFHSLITNSLIINMYFVISMVISSYVYLYFHLS